MHLAGEELKLTATWAKLDVDTEDYMRVSMYRLFAKTVAGPTSGNFRSQTQERQS